MLLVFANIHKIVGYTFL